MFNKVEEIMQEHIKNCAKKEEDLILSVYKKQKGFISLEESKHLISVNKMVKDAVHVGTDYLFNGKVILTMYPPKFSEESGVFKVTWNYMEHP